MANYVIIAAAGNGARLGSEVPKQFLTINEKPVIIYSIEKFVSSRVDISQFVVACHGDYTFFLRELVKKWLPGLPLTILAGGKTRFDSVNNALSAIEKEQGLVAIHDAARPCISPRLIETSFAEAFAAGSCVPFTLLKDTIRQKNRGTYSQVERSNFIAIQTPQIFDLQRLVSAYKKATNNNHTDDASVYENGGYPLRFNAGEDTNIKITTAVDIAIASELLKNV